MACSVAGCDHTGRLTRGMCKTHYARWLRHGDAGSAELQHVVKYDGVLCSIEGCPATAASRGWCGAHWKRWRRWGDPLGSRPITPAVERFNAKVEPGCTPQHRPELGPCTVWIAGLTAQGYGVFHPSKTELVLAHRWAYIQEHGEIPDGLVIDHLCRVRVCVRVDHLEAVTNLENLRRGAGYALQNGMRSWCINGHDYTPKNIYIDPNGGIRCRECSYLRESKRPMRPRKAG